MKICVVGTRGFPETQGGVEKHCEILYTTMGKQCPVEICGSALYPNKRC